MTAVQTVVLAITVFGALCARYYVTVRKTRQNRSRSGDLAVTKSVATVLVDPNTDMAKVLSELATVKRDLSELKHSIGTRTGSKEDGELMSVAQRKSTRTSPPPNSTVLTVAEALSLLGLSGTHLESATWCLPEGAAERGPEPH